ncbi:MAG: CRISPR-associated helicase Cas3' [Chloroflexi bacterium]|nr:CRISPR-associated helicase Cas3' [Chloroflexota bacterium]
MTPNGSRISTNSSVTWADIWAKSPLDRAEQGESLAAHTEAVVRMVGELARTYGMRPFGPFSQGWDLVFRAALIHDFGKMASGFQRALRRGPRWPYRHEVLSLAFLPWVTDDLPPEHAWLVGLVIATHHKDWPQLEEQYLGAYEPEDDPLRAMLAELPEPHVRAMWEWLQGPGARLAREISTIVPLSWHPGLLPPWPQAWEGLADAEALRERLQELDAYLREQEDALYERVRGVFAWVRRGVLTRGYLLQADHMASAGLRTLPGLPLTRERVLQGARLSPRDLYGHQRRAGQVQGHALLIAPTGSGKTEAALLWAAAQQRARLFYTLPYQASMNAMYDRLRGVFGAERVGLLHGRSTLALYRRLMDGAETPEEAARLARLLRHRAGMAYYPVRVLSPYQMLKATFQLKGFEALLADFAGAAFVFDEIHAYEPARLAMILETVAYLAQHFGSVFLFMSATFPRPLRERLAERLPQHQVLQADESVYRGLRRHRLFLEEGDLLEAMPRIVEEARAGRQVLVVANTVQRAQRLWQALRSHLNPEGIPLFLLHSRFTGRDRLRKEEALLQAAGLGASTRTPLVVVATQVVEVSLNLDLDVLYTDPAPLEALLQRFGRVNRKAHRAPAPVRVFRSLDEPSRYIYRPAIQVEQTLAVLEAAVQEQGQGFVLDEARLGDWLDQVYQGDVVQAWEATYEKHAQDFRRNFLGDLLPFRGNPALADAFDRLFDGTEVLPEGLYDEWEQMRSERPLEAYALLVPLSWGQYHQLVQAGRLLPREGDLPPIARVPYSQDLGLLLKADEAEFEHW